MRINILLKDMYCLYLAVAHRPRSAYLIITTKKGVVSKQNSLEIFLAKSKLFASVLAEIMIIWQNHIFTLVE